MSINPSSITKNIHKKIILQRPKEFTILFQYMHLPLLNGTRIFLSFVFRPDPLLRLETVIVFST